MIRLLGQPKDDELKIGITGNQICKSLHQQIEALLMRFGAGCQQHWRVRGDTNLSQPLVWIKLGFKPWQRPLHWVGQQQLRLCRQLLLEPLSGGPGLHDMQRGPAITKPPQHPPGECHRFQRREIPLGHCTRNPQGMGCQQQLHGGLGGHADGQAHLLLAQPMAQATHPPGESPASKQAQPPGIGRLHRPLHPGGNRIEIEVA